jgi:clan AA aspartic protease (TIGR02281 family)
MKKILLSLMFLIISLPLSAEEYKEESFSTGIKYFSDGEYKKAIKAFEQTVRNSPDNAEAYRWLGMSYLKLGDNEIMTDPGILDRAVEYFTKALNINPNLAEAHYNLGITYLALHNKEAAIKEYEILKTLNEELANLLFVRIGDYTLPKMYNAISETESHVQKVTIIGNEVLVPVTLAYQDKTVQAVLLLDTGASVTTINTEIAARLGILLDKTEKAVSYVVGGALIEARRTKLSYIKVGPYTNNNVDINIVEHKGVQVMFDGLLGMNVLRNLIYHVDFNNRVINWSP